MEGQSALFWYCHVHTVTLVLCRGTRICIELFISCIYIVVLNKFTVERALETQAFHTVLSEALRLQDVVDMGYQHQLVVTEELSVELMRSKGASKVDELAQPLSITATHHIPLVADLVRKIDTKRRLFTLQLPQGLVQLGRQDAYCELLAKEIPQYTKKLTNRLRDRVLGEREFPSLQTLRAAGRSDLVQLIRRAGGLATVASYIGLRSPRKPQGYFEDLQVLDWELSCFIASGWVYMAPLQEPLLTSAHLAAVSSAGNPNVATSSGITPSLHFIVHTSIWLYAQQCLLLLAPLSTLSMAA